MNELEKFEKKKPLLSYFNLTQSEHDFIESRIDKLDDLGNGWFSVLLVIVLFCFFIFSGNFGSTWFIPLILAFIYFSFVDFSKKRLINSLHKKKNYEEYHAALWKYKFEYSELKKKIEKEELEKKLAREKKLKELRKKNFQFWIDLNPYEFEKEITELFKRHGFNAKTTKGSGDEGIDIFLEKDGKKGIAQCKNQKTKVSPAVIRDLYGSMVSGNYSFGCVICPSGFSDKSFDFARDKNITLLGLKRIMELVNSDTKDITFIKI